MAGTVDEQLRAAGLRVTAPRRVVLALLREGGHRTVEELADLARGRVGTLSTQAAYDVVHALVGAGLARAVETAGSARRYEARAADDHEHVVCRRCGAIGDVPRAAGSASVLRRLPSVESAGGFVIDGAEVTYRGMCPACQHDQLPATTRAATEEGARR